MKRNINNNEIAGYPLTNKILLKILKKMYLKNKEASNNKNDAFNSTIKEIIDHKTINVKNTFLLIVALENHITNYDFLLDINKKTITSIATDEYIKNNPKSHLIMRKITIHDLEMNTLYQHLSKYFSIEPIDLGYVCTNKKTGRKTLCINESKREVA